MIDACLLSSISHISQSLDWVVSSSVSSLDLEIKLSKIYRLPLTRFVISGVVSRAHNARNTILVAGILESWESIRGKVSQSFVICLPRDCLSDSFQNVCKAIVQNSI